MFTLTKLSFLPIWRPFGSVTKDYEKWRSSKGDCPSWTSNFALCARLKFTPMDVIQYTKLSHLALRSQKKLAPVGPVLVLSNNPLSTLLQYKHIAVRIAETKLLQNYGHVNG